MDNITGIKTDGQKSGLLTQLCEQRRFTMVEYLLTNVYTTEKDLQLFDINKTKLKKDSFVMRFGKNNNKSKSPIAALTACIHFKQWNIFNLLIKKFGLACNLENLILYFIRSKNWSILLQMLNNSGNIPLDSTFFEILKQQYQLNTMRIHTVEHIEKKYGTEEHLTLLDQIVQTGDVVTFSSMVISLLQVYNIDNWKAFEESKIFTHSLLSQWIGICTKSKFFGFESYLLNLQSTHLTKQIFLYYIPC